MYNNFSFYKNIQKKKNKFNIHSIFYINYFLMSSLKTLYYFFNLNFYFIKEVKLDLIFKVSLFLFIIIF